MEKTITTKRGIEVDLELTSHHNGNGITTLEVLALIEEGTKTFYLEVPNDTGLCNEFNEAEFLDDADTTEIEDWADSEIIGYLSGKLNKWCVDNSETGVYYSVSICTFNTFTAIVTKRVGDRLVMGSVDDEFKLQGEKEIREFLETK